MRVGWGKMDEEALAFCRCEAQSECGDCFLYDCECCLEMQLRFYTSHPAEEDEIVAVCCQMNPRRELHSHHLIEGKREQRWSQNRALWYSRRGGDFF